MKRKFAALLACCFFVLLALRCAAESPESPSPHAGANPEATQGVTDAILKAIGKAVSESVGNTISKIDAEKLSHGSGTSWTTVLVMLATSLGGGGTAAIVAKWLDYKTATRTHRESFETGMMVRMQARIEHLEKAHEDCTKNAMSLAIEVGSLRESVRKLTESQAALNRIYKIEDRLEEIAGESPEAAD